MTNSAAPSEVPDDITDEDFGSAFAFETEHFDQLHAAAVERRRAAIDGVPGVDPLPLFATMLPDSSTHAAALNAHGYQLYVWDPVRIIQAQVAALPADFELRRSSAQQIAGLLARPVADDPFNHLAPPPSHVPLDTWDTWMAVLRQRITDLLVCVAEIEADVSTLREWLENPDTLNAMTPRIRPALSPEAQAHWDRAVHVDAELACSSAVAAATAVAPVLDIVHRLRDLPPFLIAEMPTLDTDYNTPEPAAGQLYLNALRTHLSDLNDVGVFGMHSRTVMELSPHTTTGQPPRQHQRTTQP